MDNVWYLAGPMSNIPQFNFPAFYAATTHLREEGWNIISPAELDDPIVALAAFQSRDGKVNPEGDTWGDFLSRDVKIIADEVSGIILMPGWIKSRGARLEAYVGIECGHQFREFRGVHGYPSTISRERILGQLAHNGVLL